MQSRKTKLLSDSKFRPLPLMVQSGADVAGYGTLARWKSRRSHHPSDSMKSLREAVEELGKDLQTLTTAVQDLTSQLTQKVKPVIPRPPRLRAIRER